jgi:glycosyltransferase involved in cell wall biosynthesis
MNIGFFARHMFSGRTRPDLATVRPAFVVASYLESHHSYGDTLAWWNIQLTKSIRCWRRASILRSGIAMRALSSLFIFSAIEPRADATAPRPARPRFLFVGRLTASKGIVQLLQEFAALSAFDLHVIGDGELRGELQHERGALRIVVATGLRAWIARGSRSEGTRGFLAAVYTTASPQRLPGSRGVNPTRKGRSLRFSCVRS